MNISEDKSTTRLYQNKICVYAHSVYGKIFYIGKGTSSRASDGYSRNSIWESIVSRARHFDVKILSWHSTEVEASIEERRLVEELSPEANIVFTERGRGSQRNAYCEIPKPALKPIVNLKMKTGRLSDLVRIKQRTDWSKVNAKLKALEPGGTVSIRCPGWIRMEKFRSTVLTSGKRIHKELHNGEWALSTKREGDTLHIFLVPKGDCN